MKTYFRLLSFGRPYSRYAIPYFICVILYTIFNTFTYVMLFPIIETMFDPDAMMSSITSAPEFSLSTTYFQELINYWLYSIVGGKYDVQDMLFALAILTVIIVLLSNTFRYLAQRIMENLKIHTLENLRNTVFDKVIRLQVSFFSSQRKGDIISKITSDVQVVQYCVTNTLQVMIKEPLLLGGYLAVLISISGELTIFTILVLPVIALFIGTIVKKLRRSARLGQEAFAEVVSTLDESLGSIKTVKSYNATEYVADKFKTQNGLFANIQRYIAARQQLASPVSETLGVSSLSIILVYGGSMILSGELAPAAFFTYLAIFSQITRPARSIADAFGNINQGIAAGTRVLELIDTPIEVKDKVNAEELVCFKDSIEFKDVSFAYEERTILHNISFKIAKGETVALVGPSGGGKSTISDLIPRFYDPQQGSITIDGKDTRDYTLSSIRDKMGIVAQDTILFNDTIEGNIRMGNNTASKQEVVEAARIAGALEFIESSDSGFDTNIGDRGMKLSGGQRQRLSIARAVLRNPEILILDEATSALDTQSERIVQESLLELLKGRTSLVIAHRLSTITGSDRIIVIEGGEIVEQGTHNELIAHNGLYSKLLAMQQIK